MSSAAPVLAAPEKVPKSAAPAVSPVRSLRVQRKCSCGGDCEGCKKKEPQSMLQRKAVPGAPPTHVAPLRPASPAAPHVPAPVPAASATPAPAKAAPKPAAAGAQHTPPSPVPAPKPPAVKAPKAKDSDHATAAKEKPKSAAPAITEKKKAGQGESDLPPVVRRVLDTPGDPLELGTRTDMESRFGSSFRDVRIHTGALAAESARAVYAHAYTVGEHIVFDSGQYQPHTTEGQRLLAHELAHTIQQHGLQKSGGPVASDKSGDYQHLESEAEGAARTVMQRPPVAGAPVSPARATQARLSRAPSSELISCDADESDRVWTKVPPKGPLKRAHIKAYSLPGKDVLEDPNHDKTRKTGGKIMVAVDMQEPFPLPAEKGNAIDVWKQRMSGCNLEAIIDPGDGSVRTKAGLKQQRPKPEQLRKIWLQRVGWNSDYEEKWLATVKATKAGKANAAEVDLTSSFEPTRAMDTECQVDHILELQVGGNDTPENMQMLDAKENEKSGRDIFNWLAERAVEVKNAFADPKAMPDLDIQSVLMRFSAIQPSKPICGPCCQADAKAEKLRDTGAGGQGVEFPLKAGGTPTIMVASSKDDTHVGLAGSPIPRNKAASTLISGLSLIEWSRKTTKKSDGGIVKAELDTKSQSKKKTALPKTLQGEKPFELKRDAEDGTLKLADKHPNLKAHYDFLSEVSIHSLNIEDDNTISGAGTITPSLKGFLPTFDVAFDKERFALSKNIPKDKFKLPIPGFAVTEAKLGIELGPEFRPDGNLKFVVGTGTKQVLRGELSIRGDETNGLTAHADVFATIPGVDEAKGELDLKNNEWSGGINVKTAGNGKVKYIRNVDVAIQFSQKDGLSASGQVELDVPGVKKPVNAKVAYDSNGWSFAGSARFHPPRLNPVDINLVYAHGSLSGHGETEFEFRHQKGKIHVNYEDGRFSGKGTLTISTKRAEGSITVEMQHRPNGDLYFTGEGHATFKITDDIEAGAGVKIDEQEKVTVTGELVFTKPILLFKGFGDNRTFFHWEQDFPLPPPLSIGGVGLEATLKACLSAQYFFGPVQLEDVKATADFQPLEENPDLKLDLSGQLVIKATGSVSGTIRGGIKLNAYIAYIKGELGITATAALRGLVHDPFRAHYENGKITVDIGFDTELTFALILALTASVEAKAGFSWFSVRTGKEWALGTYAYPPKLALQATLRNPIHYESPDHFTLPSVDDFELKQKTPISGPNLVNSTAGSSSDGEEHDVDTAKEFNVEPPDCS